MSYTAWIFTIGTELVQGRVVNTNAAYIGRRLTLLGFNVIGVITLVDDVEIVSKYLSSVLLHDSPRVIVTTGGLGPTYDDRTLEAVAKALNRRLILNEEAFKAVKEKYDKRGLPLTPERIKMAYLPEGAKPIPNPIGTAPGSWIEHENTIIVSLPGVPNEMMSMWEGWVEPRLKSIGPSIHIAEITIRLVGVPEASLAPFIEKAVKKFARIYVKSHPRGEELGKPVIELYIMASDESSEKAIKIAEDVAKFIADSLHPYSASVERLETRVS
ncbi:MAG: nicotinamide mononucleotide deamidase-related protein [Ignisphaera sp.]